MDKQLHSQFIDDPFVVDPMCTTYSQLFERARMDAFLARTEKQQHGHSFRTNGPGRGGRQESSSSDNGSHHYIPYDKEGDHGRTTDSFREGRKPTLCLRCGAMGHRAGNCTASVSNRPDQPIICSWKNNCLISKNDKSVCVLFNVRGSCNEQTSSTHGIHICSLCNDGNHAACRCTQN